MTTASLERISKILSDVAAPSAFSAQRTRPADDLHLTVATK